MISRPLTRVVNSTEMFVAPGATILAEGSALVRVGGATSAGVQPSTGAAGEVFVGLSFAGTSAYPFPEGSGNKVEEFTVGIGGVVTLARTPLTGAVGVYDLTLGRALVAGTDFTLVSNTLTGLTVGDDIVATYRFNLSVVEAVALYGNVQPGGYSGAYVNQIGVIRSGFVMTSEFDASKSWAGAGATAATALVAGANGQLTLGTVGTNGASVPGAVTRVPDDGYPFLGIEFTAFA